MGGATAGGSGDSGRGVGLSSGLGKAAGAWPADSIVEVTRCVHTTGLALPVVAKAANATMLATAAARAAGAKRSGADRAIEADR